MMGFVKVSSAVILSLCFSVCIAERRAAAAQIEQQVRTADGVVLHYKVAGQGAPILLLAGGPGFSGDFLIPVMNELSKTHQCILLDQRGTGKSRMPVVNASNINLKAAVSDIETLRAHLKIDKLTILGHSWGGGMALAYAAQHPARVKALLLMSSVGMDQGMSKYFGTNIRSRMTPADLEARAYWSEPARVEVNPNRAFYELIRALLPGYVVDRKSALKMIEDLKEEFINVEVFQLMSEDLARNYDVRAALADFKQPVLIVQGRQDPIGESTAYRTQQILSHARLEFIEVCGHYPWVEQPQQLFALLKDFLRTLN